MTYIDDSRTGNFSAHGDGAGKGVELEMGNGMSVRRENDLAAEINRQTRKVGIEILTSREAVDLNRDALV